jgi:NADPH:quinone reductase-like Zn-dependent oxidoreductase
MQRVAAWQVVGVGEPLDVFELREVELPAPPPGQIRLRVGAAAVGFPDVAMCRGVYALTPKHPFTPGQELVGTVTAVGGEAFHAATRCIAHEGRLLAVGFAGGQWGQPSIPHMVQRNYSVVGVMPGNGYDLAFKQRSHDALLALWREGRLRPSIHRAFPFAEVPEAVAEVAAGKPMGKVIVDVAG